MPLNFEVSGFGVICKAWGAGARCLAADAGRPKGVAMQVDPGKKAMARAAGLAVMGWLLSVASVAAPAAAAVDRDPDTGRQPFDLIRLWRGCPDKGGNTSTGCQPMPANTALQACDRLEFAGPKSSTATARIAVHKGGLSIILSAAQPWANISCEPTAWTQAMVDAWAGLAGKGRAAMAELPRPGFSRGGAFDLPLLAAPQIQLVAGKRRLHLGWHGGAAPYAVRLERLEPHSVVLDWTAASGHRTVLPEIDFSPGRYSLTLRYASDKPDDLNLRVMDKLIVVPRRELPAAPRELGDARLSALEQQLLTAFALEAQADGRWLLEAYQAVAPRAQESAAAAAWLRQYASD